VYLEMSKSRGRQRRPTQTELACAWARLRAAADRGDLQANALLISLAEAASRSQLLALPQTEAVNLKPPVSAIGGAIRD
jgi:hypothetical protein